MTGRRGRVVTVDPDCSVHLGQRSAPPWRGGGVRCADGARGEGMRHGRGAPGLSVPESQVNEVDQGTRRPQQCVIPDPAELPCGEDGACSHSGQPRRPSRGFLRRAQLEGHPRGAAPDSGAGGWNTTHTRGHSESGHSRLVWLHGPPSAGPGPRPVGSVCVVLWQMLGAAVRYNNTGLNMQVPLGDGGPSDLMLCSLPPQRCPNLSHLRPHRCHLFPHQGVA